AGLAAGIQIIVTVINNAGELIGAAFNNIVVTLEGVGEFFGDVIANIGAVIQNAIGGIEIGIGNALQGIARFLRDLGVDSGSIGLSGAEMTGRGLERQLGVAGQLGGITSVWDRIQNRLIDLTQMVLLPSDSQISEMRGNMEKLWFDLYNVAAGLFGGTVIQRPTAGGGDGLTMGGGGGMGLTPDQLQEISDLWK